MKKNHPIKIQTQFQNLKQQKKNQNQTLAQKIIVLQIFPNQKNLNQQKKSQKNQNQIQMPEMRTKTIKKKNLQVFQNQCKNQSRRNQQKNQKRKIHQIQK